MKVRARSSQDKEARRRAILMAAGKLLDKKGAEGLTMAAVARDARLAKGTLYLYFATREEMLLALLQEELAGFFGAVVERFGPARAVTPAQLARGLTVLVEARPRMVRLLGLLNTIVEHNVGESAVRAFKFFLRDNVGALGVELERRMAGLPRGSGARALLLFNALVVGVDGMAHPAAVVDRVLQEPGLQALRLDFSRELEKATAALFTGLLANG